MTFYRPRKLLGPDFLRIWKEPFGGASGRRVRKPVLVKW